MKIRILKSNEVRHIDNSTGEALISAGLAERAGADDRVASVLPKPGAAGVVQPKWEVVEHAGTERTFLALKMTVLHQTYIYSGAPDEINDRSFGRPVEQIPEEILAEYRRQYRANPALRDQYSKYTGIPGETNCPENEKAGHEKKNWDDAIRNGSVPRAQR